MLLYNTVFISLFCSVGNLKLKECIFLYLTNKHTLMELCIYREFAKEKERVESRAGFMQLKEQQKLEKELNG